MKNSGYIKLSRDFPYIRIWDSDGACKLLLFLLCRVTTREYGSLQPGQMATSKEQLAKDMSWSRTTLMQHLRELQNSGLIQVNASAKGTVITILGWNDIAAGQIPNHYYPDSYDSFRSQPRQHLNENPSSIRPLASCQDLTLNNRITGDNQMTRRNNNTYDPSSTAEMPDYELLWRMYPQHRRGALRDARTAVAEALAKGATIEGITQALETDLRSESWIKEGGKYVPGFAKWLGREPWPTNTTEGDNEVWRF